MCLHILCARRVLLHIWFENGEIFKNQISHFVCWIHLWPYLREAKTSYRSETNKRAERIKKKQICVWVCTNCSMENEYMLKICFRIIYYDVFECIIMRFYDWKCMASIFWNIALTILFFIDASQNGERIRIFMQIYEYMWTAEGERERSKN